MTYFKLPRPCASNTPFNQLHVWKWADKQVERKSVTRENYLKAVGFTIGEHKLIESKLELLRMAIDEWHRSTPIIRELRSFDEVFGLPIAGQPMFSFYEDHKRTQVNLIESTRAALQERWIYTLDSDNCYFELINGKVWAKYQTILGSKPLVRLK